MTIRAEVSQVTPPESEPAEIRIHVFSDVPLEISSVTVRDRLSNSIFQEWIPDCDSDFEKRIHVSRRLLGVSVSATHCGTGAVVDLGSFLSPPPDVLPCDPSDPTPAPQACVDAQTRVTTAADDIRFICTILVGLEASIRAWRQVVVASLAAAAVLLAAAAVSALLGPYGVAVAIALAALAILPAAVAVLAGIRLGLFLNERANAHRDLVNRQRDFGNAAADVRRLCCPHEIRVSLDTPGC